MLIYSKPTMWDEKSGYWSGRGTITAGPVRTKPKEDEKPKEEFLKEEEFKV